MKEKYIKAVESLKKKVEWLAKNNKINQKILNEYNDILVSLADYFNYSQKTLESHEAESLEMTFQITRMKEEQKKLTLLLRLTGMHPAYISELMQAPTFYLERELEIIKKTGNYLQHPTLVDLFRHYFRHYKNMVQADKDVLQSFSEFAKMKRTNTLQMLIDQFYEGYPHLSSFFSSIEDNPTCLSNSHFRSQIIQTIEKNHLWN